MAIREKGIALVAVLWITVLLSTLAAGLVTNIHAQGSWVAGELDAARAEALADAGVFDAVARMVNKTDGPLPLDGSPYEVKVANHRVAVSVQDELGKLDLNTGSPEYLTRLFRTSGISAGDAAGLVDKILDWRDADDLRRSNGAENRDYGAQSKPYGPRNGPFRSVEELKLVLGVKEELFLRIEPSLTVYAQGEFVNPMTAPRDVLVAVGYSAEEAERLITQRSTKGTAPDAISVVSPKDSEEAGQAFTIRAEVAVAQERKFRRLAVVRLTGDPSDPYWFQRWSIE